MSGMSRSQTSWVSLLAVTLGALLSWLKGQDTNWDLLNYHHYVAYAFLHDRLALDLAAADLQSYFNPSLDIPIYWLNERLDARLVGGLVGAWHALIFVFTLLIARDVWPATARGSSLLLTALTGVLAPAFWGGLGNSMGDNAAAVLALAALWCAVRFIKHEAADVGSGGWWLAGAGFLLGLCTALKLTNGSVAVALGLALLITVRAPKACVKVVVLMVPTGVLGFALGGGWWFHQVWQQFGNPFFPQFGKLFPSEFADSVAVVDRRFIPESVGAYLLRPLLMPFKSEITSEFFVLPLLWPVWFGAGVLYLFKALKARWQSTVVSALIWSPAQQLVLCFVLLAVCFWEALFGIYRYAVALEPLLPLCVVLLLWRSGFVERFQPWLRRVFIASMVCTLLGGSVNWGHTGWAERSFRPASAMRVEGLRPFVLMVGTGNSWLIPFLNPQAHFASVGGSFHFGQRYDAEIVRRAQAADRVYAVVGMSQNWRFDVVDKVNDLLDSVGALHSQPVCNWLGRVIQRTRPHLGIERCEGAACSSQQCVLTKLPADQAEVDRRDRASLDGAMTLLRGYGLAVDASQCTVEGAYLGQKRYPFRLCELERVAALPTDH